MSQDQSPTTREPPAEIYVEAVEWGTDGDEEHLLWVGREPSSSAGHAAVRYVRADVKDAKR